MNSSCCRPVPGTLPVLWRWLLSARAVLSHAAPLEGSFLQVLTCGAEGAALPPRCRDAAWPFPPLALGTPACDEAAEGSAWAGSDHRETQRWHGDGMGTHDSTPPAEPLRAHLPSAVPVSHWCWVLGSRGGRLSPISSGCWRTPCRTSPQWLGALQFILGIEALGKISHRTSTSCSSSWLGPPDHPESLGCERFCSKLSSLRSDLKA